MRNSRTSTHLRAYQIHATLILHFIKNTLNRVQSTPEPNTFSQEIVLHNLPANEGGWRNACSNEQND
ncbi:hypothetical protein TNCV_2339781 [Trichonephila clavipes]|nr:hypothetical protein TNCV_2339781 [Trichonephila clavipes]